MAMSVVYTTINGVLYHENRGGVETEYVPDTLGSLIQCRDSSGNVTYTADYWPYGEVRTSTGSKSSPWGFVGLLGYLTDITKRLYVRARQYRPNVGQWQTVDPLWPGESTYSYGNSNPSSDADPSGMQIVSPGGKDFGDGLYNSCKLGFNNYNNRDLTDCEKRAQEVADWIASGRWKDRDIQNAIGHCNAACEIYRACGSDGWDRWDSREHLPSIPTDHGKDTHNNLIGKRVGGMKGVSCLQGCINNYWKLWITKGR
jgi:RHS repeat-associated protein